MPHARPIAGGRVVLAALLTSSCAACEEPSTELPPVGLEAGSLAPVLEGTTLVGGEEYRLQDEPGDRLVVLFRSGDCSLCILRFRELAQQVTEYESLGVSPVAATPNPEGDAFRAAAEGELGFPATRRTGFRMRSCSRCWSSAGAPTWS